MSKQSPKDEAHMDHDAVHPEAAAMSDDVSSAETTSTETRDTVIATAATVGVVAVGALVFEAALIPGLILGAAAALAPQVAPRLGSALNPLFRSTVRGAYRLGQKSREMFAEAQEHISDIAAEVHAEEAAKTETVVAAEPHPVH